MKIEFLGKCLFIIRENKEKVLVVGDLHLGYEEVLNRSGVFVSREMFKEIKTEFCEIFEKTGKLNKIILLGDVKHEFSKAIKQEWKEVGDLFTFFEENLEKKGEILIIRGNHDNYLLNIISKIKNVKLDEYFLLDKIGFVHGNKRINEIEGKDIGIWVMGHMHPAIKIKDNVKMEKFKCFLDGKYKDKRVVIVPSFLNYNIGSDPRDNFVKMGWEFNLNNFDVEVIGENLEVHNFGKLKKIE